MYKTAAGDEVFVIDGHTHGQAVRSHIAACQEAFAAGELDMSVGDIDPETALVPEVASDRLILTGLCLPGNDGRPAWDVEALQRLRATWGIRGVAIVPPAWPPESRVYHLYTRDGFRYLSACERLGVCNIHLHSGTTHVPEDRAAYDLEDLERAASSFPGLNFIVEHAGMPWFEDFCWIATRELNVYAGLGHLMPFVVTKPRYFATLLAELLFWLGPDRLIFGGDDSASPRALVEAFMAFDLPPDLCAEYRVGLTLDIRRQVLGENFAHLYGVKIPSA